MPQTTIDRLIINSPYEEPARHCGKGTLTKAASLSSQST
jgi:hypothetical protein